MIDGKQSKAIQDRSDASGLSLKRTSGFALDRLWMYMIFYSIVPFVGFSDVRYSLYLCLSISLVSMMATLFVIAALARRSEVIAKHPLLPWGSASLMSLGTAVILAAGVVPDGDMPVLMIGIGGVVTGIGSAALLVCWLETLSLGRRNMMLPELALGCSSALLVSLMLLFLPAAIGDCLVFIAPLGSAYLLTGCAKNVASPPERDTPTKRSRKTISLFVRALIGAFAFGALAGFFDAFAGFRTFRVDDVYGVFLLAFGFAAMLVVALISVFSKENAISNIYRFAMALMCLGCLMTLFMGDSNTYAGGVVFAGYETFSILIALCCVQAARSFDLPLARAFGFGFATLYLGETVGSFAIYLAGDAILASGLLVITLGAVLWLFLSHLYLFSEIDLIDISLGELSGDTPVFAPSEAESTIPQEGQNELETTENERQGAAPVGNEQVCQVIVRRYGLSPRESDVLELVVQGRTIARIQDALFISAGTVSTHIRHIYQKTGSRNKQELLDLAEAIRSELQSVEEA